MFHEFALAFKTKTIELFANDDGGAAPEEAVITGQRVVVIKPDQPPGHIKLHKLHAMVGALFAAAAYHLLQAAHAPPNAAAAESVDRAAVSHLARLSDLKRAHLGKLPVALPSQLKADRGAREPEPAPHLRLGREPVEVGDRWKRAGEEESRQATKV